MMISELWMLWRGTLILLQLFTIVQMQTYKIGNDNIKLELIKRGKVFFRLCLVEQCFYAKRSQLPHHIAFMILKESLFWFMMGKSSWVPSHTQGSTPMLFCRWSNVLWLLHSLLVPSHGRWLDQGRWSLYLLFCFCGNDRTMALYPTKYVCVTFELWSFRYLRTWFAIILSTWYIFYECG